MRAAVAVVTLAYSVSVAAQAPPNEIYRAAVTTYIKTGDVVKSAGQLKDLEAVSLEAAVKDTIATHDSVNTEEASFLEAAALLHLEIGLAIVGIASESSEAHFELGERLVDSLVPRNPAVTRNLPKVRQAEIARIRSTWHAVAGSVFLSVNDSFRARPLLHKAGTISPKDAAILTLRGTAEEVDGMGFNPDDWDALNMRVRVGRERARILYGAERLYREALKADPGYPLAQIRLGRVMHLSGNRKEAATWLTKGFLSAVEPSHQYVAAMFMGAFRQDEKDLDGAREAFETAMTIAPRSQNAMVALAYVELLAGRANRSQELARNHLLTPESDHAWWASKNGTLDLVGLEWLRTRTLR
jgi:tetratricopeptide (TPR) repeat protein